MLVHFPDRPDRIQQVERILRRIALVSTPEAAADFVAKLNFDDLFETYQHTALSPQKPGYEHFNLAVRAHMTRQKLRAITPSCGELL